MSSAFAYVTAHPPTLQLLHLRYSSSSNPSFASTMSQALHLIHLASRPCRLHVANTRPLAHQMFHLTRGQIARLYLLGSRDRISFSPEGQLWWEMSIFMGFFSEFSHFTKSISPAFSTFHPPCYFIFSYIHGQGNGLVHHRNTIIPAGGDEAGRALCVPPLNSEPQRIIYDRNGRSFYFCGTFPSVSVPIK